MSPEDIDDMDPIRRHAQEPAEDDVDPGQATSSAPHAEEPAEGAEDAGTGPSAPGA